MERIRNFWFFENKVHLRNKSWLVTRWISPHSFIHSSFHSFTHSLTFAFYFWICLKRHTDQVIPNNRIFFSMEQKPKLFTFTHYTPYVNNILMCLIILPYFWCRKWPYSTTYIVHTHCPIPFFWLMLQQSTLYTSWLLICTLVQYSCVASSVFSAQCWVFPYR